MRPVSPALVGVAAVKDDSQLLASVEAYLTDSHNMPVFPAWLEARYEREVGPRVSQSLAGDTIKTAVVYNLLILGDLLLAPDVVGVACALHLAVVTPLMLAISAALRQAPPRWMRDVAGALLPLLMIGHIVAVYSLSRAPSAANYLYFVTMAALFANTTLRLDYRAARWAAVIALALLAAALTLFTHAPLGVAILQCFAFTLGALVTLDSNLGRDRQTRISYVQTLRDRMRVAATASEARRDALTGLANRRRLEEAASAIWRDGEASGLSPVSAILFDVDRFKAFNDSYGHQAGDLCLARIAECAAGALPGRDSVTARWGGEEFMLLAPHTRLDEAERIAERLRRAIIDLNIGHDYEGGPGRVTASFGVASVEISEDDFDALTAAADAALYEAKRSGRNKVTAAPTSIARRR